MLKLIAGKVVYGVICLFAAVLLVVAGYAHKVVGQVTATEKGIAIKGGATLGATVGSMNILVMGLESRTNYQGQTLPNSLLTAMHAGNASAVSAGQVGSQDTNTLILIHVFAGGKKAVGFSIPRDDLVNFPQAYDGQTEGKIDAAYAYAYVQYVNQNAGKESTADLYLHANQAGQAATIATVQSVTGQKIDHFAEVNLAGFYYLAAAFNGIEVCIQPYPGNHGLNLTDHDPFTGTDNSGFDAFKDGYNEKKGGTQYLHLGAAQSLAFVRSRDTLPGTDLGRTKRQQAVIDYVIYQLKHEGVFSGLGKLNSLLSTANQYLITDAGFNLLDFATDMQALNGQDLSFTTLPFTPENNVPVPGYPGPQDVNVIDIPAIQKLVASEFNPQPDALAAGATATSTAAGGKSTTSPAESPLPDSRVTVDVYNGDRNAGGLASQVSQALTGLGYHAGKVLNASAQKQTVQPGTQVFYGAGAAGNAQQIAVQFGATAAALSTLPADHVEVLIGSTVTTVPAGIAPTAGTATAATQVTGAQVIGAGAAAGPTATPTPSPTATDGSSGTGGSVVVAPKAPYGIPCVY
jgi:anionic cell wall polymer biosynthesis LytR-Cps2A-Psr (LCP) family protein